MRALKLQKENCVDDALSLFSELLETQVLFEVIFLTIKKFYIKFIDFSIFIQITKTHTSKTLKSIKYNCYKNIGFIHNNKNNNETALEFLLKVIITIKYEKHLSFPKFILNVLK